MHLLLTLLFTIFEVTGESRFIRSNLLPFMFKVKLLYFGLSALFTFNLQAVRFPNFELMVAFDSFKKGGRGFFWTEVRSNIMLTLKFLKVQAFSVG